MKSSCAYIKRKCKKRKEEKKWSFTPRFSHQEGKDEREMIKGRKLYLQRDEKRRENKGGNISYNSFRGQVGGGVKTHAIRNDTKE